MITALLREQPALAGLNRLLEKPGARQLVRYAIAGFMVTQFSALIYSVVAMGFHVEPLVANVISTLCGVVVGYLVHDRWSFAGGAAANDAGKVARFLIATLLGFAVNSLWVWLLVTTLRFPPLAPVPLMMFATPWVSFFINRYWVFKAA
jgi:putative flippase GtrA